MDIQREILFQKYGELSFQQGLLEDTVRTGEYYRFITDNEAKFKDSIVVDVGAGTGILSLFAIQAGAKRVYAVEASDFAESARVLCEKNDPDHKIEVIKSKIEDVYIPEAADILICQPMGDLLVGGRIGESYVRARDRLIHPKGEMFPSMGRIYLAPMSNGVLHDEITNQACFWKKNKYFDINLQNLYEGASKDHFSQPIICKVGALSLVADPCCHEIDYKSIQEEDLRSIHIPFTFQPKWEQEDIESQQIHGIACWFDVLFDSTDDRWCLSTAPEDTPTRWKQLCCLLSTPIDIQIGEQIVGFLHMDAYGSTDYALDLQMSVMVDGVVGDTSTQHLYLNAAVGMETGEGDEEED